MLELITGYTLSQVPYITYDALEVYAENIVWDFAPELLNNPGPVDTDRFLEFYLRLTVDSRRISHTKQILGMTAFSNGIVEILNEETGAIEDLPVTAGTVIIDASLETKRNIPRRRFTMTHEGCHWLLHRKAFAEDNPFGPAGIYENRYLAAKEGRMDYSRSTKERTDVDMMERQADFLTSAILMPRPALRKAFRTFFSYYDDQPHRIVRGANPMDDAYAKQLPEYVAKVFNVSKRAALIRLEKLTAIVDKGWGYVRP
jgi:Zn-dependent peptidase ImmA (M78 family)